MRYEVEGDLDLRRFLGLAGGPRAGFTEIRVKAHAKARNASAEELQELCRYVQETSPVRDILANPFRSAPRSRSRRIGAVTPADAAEQSRRRAARAACGRPARVVRSRLRGPGGEPAGG